MSSKPEMKRGVGESGSASEKAWIEKRARGAGGAAEQDSGAGEGGSAATVANMPKKNKSRLRKTMGLGVGAFVWYGGVFGGGWLF